MTDATLTWTDERVERLKTLWQEGRSASAIAAELGGVSRNAVIGKVHRLGLSGRGKAPEKPAPARPRPKQAPAAAAAEEAAPVAAPQPSRPITVGANALAAALEPQPARAEAAPLAQPRPAPQPAGEIVVPLSERVTIMDLRESMCRWPMGDPSSPDFRFCGARSLTGMPYCTHHAQIAYQPSADRRRDRKALAG
ncbi:GcrA family cell cycle regulator [Salinarimonas ramus]|uniref:GcrA cell cycle regulator n=1 Tax=Salinarimonas ramus TaxID=690164 RepID=A0A917QID5_9HYPH|nr:GcrA family cell cycle regulator [Salinarimonas ramus]GGK52219.1 GcrA cell cycle regulator [Salinarimonas ramus]